MKKVLLAIVFAAAAFAALPLCAAAAPAGSGAINGLSWSPLQLMFDRMRLVSADTPVYGLDLTFFVGRTDLVYGLTLGIGSSAVADQAGVQLSIVSEAERNAGIQLGATNISRQANYGLQFGVLNIARNGGAQIGVFNYNPNSKLPYTILFNFSKVKPEPAETTCDTPAETGETPRSAVVVVEERNSAQPAPAAPAAAPVVVVEGSAK